MASQFPPKKNTAFTLFFTLYKNDGTVVANPGTITKKVSIDGGGVADIAAAITEEDTTYGQCSVVLSAGEMNGDAIWVYITDNTAGTVPFTCTLYTAAATVDELKAETAAILVDTGTDIPAQITAASAQISAIGSGTGAALNFAASDDNANDTVSGVALTHVGTETGTFANTSADDTSNHVIASADVAGTHTITWAYGFNCGVAKAASKVTWKGTLSGQAGQPDTLTFAAWNGATWDTRLVVVNTVTAVQTFDIPLLASHTTVAGLVIIRITYAEADAGTLTTNLLLVQAQQSGSLIGYAGGAVWVKTGGTAAEVPYVNGTADNPAPWANALVIAAAVGLERFVIAPGTAIVLSAAFDHKVMTGRSYDLDLGADPGNDVHKSYFEGAENLIGMGTCAGGEAIFVDCHVGALSIGKVDMVRCHWMGAITMTQDAVPYRFHDCTGISGASIIFTGSAQTAVISHASGVFSIGGMTAGNVLYLDGDCVVELLGTCDGGTVYCSGNVLLTNNSVTPFTAVTYGLPITAADAEQIRHKLNIDGTQTAPTSNGGPARLPDLLNFANLEGVAYRQMVTVGGILNDGVTYGFAATFSEALADGAQICIKALIPGVGYDTLGYINGTAGGNTWQPEPAWQTASYAPAVPPHALLAGAILCTCNGSPANSFAIPAGTMSVDLTGSLEVVGPLTFDVYCAAMAIGAAGSETQCFRGTDHKAVFLMADTGGGGGVF